MGAHPAHAGWLCKNAHFPCCFQKQGVGGKVGGEGAFRLASLSLCVSLSLKGKGPRFTHSLLSPRPPLTTGRPWPVFCGLQLLGMGGPRSPSSLSLDSLSFPVGPPVWSPLSPTVPGASGVGTHTFCQCLVGVACRGGITGLCWMNARPKREELRGGVTARAPGAGR